MAAENLTSDEIAALCDAAQAAWDKIGERDTRATFKWRGKSYVVTHTNMRMLVDTKDGQPVACRYF